MKKLPKKKLNLKKRCPTRTWQSTKGDEGEYITVENLLSSTLMTEDGDTVCSALVNIGRQLEMQNKIMVKLLTTLQKRA